MLSFTVFSFVNNFFFGFCRFWYMLSALDNAHEAQLSLATKYYYGTDGVRAACRVASMYAIGASGKAFADLTKNAQIIEMTPLTEDVALGNAGK